MRLRLERIGIGPRNAARPAPLCLAVCLAAAGIASAQCSLHEAPAFLADATASSGGTTARLGLAWRETALSAADGALSEWEASAAVASGGGWSGSLRWPFAVLSLPAGTGAGLGDPALGLDYRARASSWILGLAARLSAPLGDAGNGLGSGAFGAAGYLSSAWARERWSLGAMAGMRAMFGSGGAGHRHAHAGSSLHDAYPLAYPHADRELAGRLAWNRAWGAGEWALALDGAHVLGTAMGVPGTDFLEGEAAFRFRSGAADWKPYLRAPLSSGRRLAFGLGVSVERAW